MDAAAAARGPLLLLLLLLRMLRAVVVLLLVVVVGRLDDGGVDGVRLGRAALSVRVSSVDWICRTAASVERTEL